jgi:hypothetical protein
MPCDFEIDADHHLVRTRIYGDVTDTELLDHQRRLAADPRFGPGFSQLVDCRDVTSSRGLSAQGIESGARQHLYGHQSRRAVVAPMPDVFGMARMFETQRTLFGGTETIRVFKDFDEAVAWLAESRSGDRAAVS